MGTARLLSTDITTGGRNSGQVGGAPEVAGVEPGAFDSEGRFLFVKHPNEGELKAIHALSIREIGEQVANFAVVQSVYTHNPVSFWAIMCAGDARREAAELAGFVAYLPLNAEGVAALKAGTLDAANPDLALLAPRRIPPAALYIWAIVAHGVAELGGKLIGHAMGVETFLRLPIFGTIGTRAGLKALQKRQNAPQAESGVIGTVFEIRHPQTFLDEIRALNITWRTPAPRRVLKPRLETRLASNANDLARIFAIRAAVFMAEQSCPYDEEFDGNDYAGGHILGLVDSEPAAVLRIRYFAEFVKLERLAVLPRFRRTLIARHVVEHAIALCSRKGYRTMYGHSQKRFVHLWERFGFQPMNKNTPLAYSDFEYVEMIGEIAPHETPLTPFSDPYVLIRPEGRWDVEGVLERSAARKPTNPAQGERRM